MSFNPVIAAWAAGKSRWTPATTAAAMAAALLFTASAMALLVYRRLGLGALTRYWINLDLGWAVVFIAMGVMALMM